MSALPRKVGNVRVFLNGRAMIGPDWHVMLVSVLFIVVGSLLFVCFTNTITGARVVVGVFAALSLVLIALCGLSDPGICPKELPPPIDAPPHDPLQVDHTYTRRDGTVVSITLERKWCYSCNIYRPLRAVHCRFCDVCVCRRDHHCPWTGICIGARNYRTYFALVWSVLVLVSTAIVGGILSLVRRAGAIAAADAANNVPLDQRRVPAAAAVAATWGVELMLVLFCGLWALLVGSLATYHTYLVLYNRTSSDDAKQRGDNDNCYDRGSWLENIKASFFPPLSVMYEGGELNRSGGPWVVAVEEEEEEEDVEPMVVPNTTSAAERARRREEDQVLMQSLSSTHSPTTAAAKTDGVHVE